LLLGVRCSAAAPVMRARIRQFIDPYVRVAVLLWINQSMVDRFESIEEVRTCDSQ
jgi:hypothetical protein